jgi:cholesterol transport system auxiliary component
VRLALIRFASPAAAFRLAALAVAAVALSGCITLFPEAEPAKLYRFEIAAPSEVADKAFDVTRGNIAFTQAAASDGILTITNGEAAYIDSARWVSPAQAMFEEQLVRAFQAGPARLVSRGAPGKAKWNLRLDVQRFETVYKGDPEGAPTVVIEIKASLARNIRDGQTADQVFRAEVPTTENRVSAIVPAYNTALTKVLGEMADWVGTVGAGA